MRYRPKSNVVFGNVNLSDYGEAFAFYCNIFEKPVRDVEIVSVPGRNGDLLYDNGRYKNVERRYIVQVKGIDVAHSLMNSLLNTVGYQKLTDDYDNAFYYMARLKSAPKIIGFVGDAVKMEIVFDRMPQRWLIADSELVQEAASSNKVASMSFSVNNRTLGTSYPIVRVDFTSASTAVTTDVSLEVRCENDGSNGNIELNGLSSQNGYAVVIDSERRVIYNPTTQVNLAGKLANINNMKWLTIPQGVEGYAINVVARKTGSTAYSIMTTLNTRMWEL